MKPNLERLSGLLVYAVIAVMLLVVITMLVLGGPALIWNVRISLLEVLTLAAAATASWYFFMRLIHRLDYPAGMLTSMAIFVSSLALFILISLGTRHLLQYPQYGETYGPASGPALPLGNVLEFFRRIGDFEKVDDIAADPRAVPPPVRRAPQQISLELETREVLAELAPGISFNYWTFNGQVPGPMLRIREGDTVNFTLRNHESSLHEHNIDLHAVTGPGGGGEASVVAPGEEKSFRFRALNPGLYIYHCAVPNMAVHMSHGMYGMILVEPEGGLPEVDREFYIVQGELFTTGTIGRRGLQVFDGRKMLDSNPNYVVFNGRTGALAESMTAEVGDRVRLYVGNGGVALASSFHVVGEIFDTVYPEANIGGAQFHNVQTTAVLPGGASIVEFTVDYPGTYVLVDHALMRADKGAWGLLHVTGEADPEIFDH
ncbi:MAG: copper-containing nitrite reductase [Pseudohongiella sp.]|nr:copper-containing nitrite reductase [Pseudohongiella sp.]MDP2127564.1 copper-containing nitrite reductase [Pseudohongiella sp.]